MCVRIMQSESVRSTRMRFYLIDIVSSARYRGETVAIHLRYSRNWPAMTQLKQLRQNNCLAKSRAKLLSMILMIVHGRGLH